MKDLANQLLQRLDLRLMRSSSVDALYQHASELALRAAELDGQVGGLGKEVIELGKKVVELDGLAAELGAQNKLLREKFTESAALLDDANRLIATQLAELHRERAHRRAGFDDDAPRPLIVIVMTTVSQIPHLKAFAGARLVRQRYDLVVIAYPDMREFGLIDYCESNEIALFTGEFELLSGGLRGRITEPARPAARKYFGLSASYAAYTSEEQPLLKTTNDLLAEVHRQSRLADDIQHFLAVISANLLVLFEDNVEWDTGIWVHRAKSMRLPTVIVPYAVIDPGDAAEAHYNDPGFWAEESVHGRFVKSVLPHWVLDYRERSLLRRNALGILASESLGVAPVRPWVWNSSRANAIAVESEAMREVYLAQHTPESQIVMTGSVSDDLLFEAIRNRDQIRRQLSLDVDRPVLLCGFPPDQLSVNRPDPEFHDFRTIVQRWMEKLAKLRDWQVIVKPHPAMRKNDIDYLKTFPFPVSDADTTLLVAVCDLFNTSVSSTIRWALACGKPVLNYDVYRYRYQDFVDEPAVRTVFDDAEFASALQEMTEDRSVFEACAERARAASKRWGMLDGHSTERIVGLFDRLMLHRV